ncbi:MAG: PAS domain S-box protein [Betaproteobacteria bacterium]
MNVWPQLVAPAIPAFAPRVAATNEHFVHFYESDDTLILALRRFVAQALDNGSTAMLIATRQHFERLEWALAGQGIDLEGVRLDGRYVTRYAEDILPELLVDDWPDPEKFAAVAEPLIASLAARGRKVCVFGEAVGLLWSEGRHEAALRLEELWNGLLRKHSFSLFCAYPTNGDQTVPLDLIHRVCCEHDSATPSALDTSLSETAFRTQDVRELRRTVRRLEAGVREHKALEGKLARREQELQEFLDSISVPMHSAGSDGRILWANEAELQLLGYAREEYVGQPIARFHVDGSVAADMQRRLLNGETVEHQLARMRCKDGAIKHVLIHASGFRDDDDFLHTRCVTLDITAQRRLEESERQRDDATREVRRTRALLAAIVESSDDAIVSKTLAGVITSWNAGAVRLFGYSPEEAIGQSITIIIPPELQAEERQILEKLRRGEHIDHFETERVAKDGRRIEISLSVSPVRDGEGQIIGASKVARDVTEQRRARRELQQLRDQLAEELAGMRRLHEIGTRLVPQQKHLETLLEEILQAALEIAGDQSGCLQLWDADACRLLTSVMHGLTPAFCAMLDRQSQAVGVSGFAQRVSALDTHAAAERAGLPVDAFVEAGIQSMLSTPLVSRGGDLIGVLTVFGNTPTHPSDRELRQLDLLGRLATDAIERTRRETRLKQEDQRKNEFIAILAHELRNPLAPIRYAVSITRHPDSKPEQRHRAEEIIGRQVDHMARLLDDLLDISRISRGVLELRKGKVELATAVAAAIETARPLLDAKRHSLAVDLPPLPILLEADAVRLAQIFSNLLTNAGKYTDPGGRIELSAAVEGGEVAVRIRDNGVGMAPAMVPKLFNMFVQAGSALERSEGGLGIGLALVRGLVALHGGSVDAQSDGPGRGSEFVVRLPLAPSQEIQVPAGPAAPQAENPALKVLIADDNRDIAETCGLLVGLLGHEVHVAYSGEQAFELAEKLRPDMLLLDIGMPDISGYDLARRIRAADWATPATLVAVTGWGQEEDKQRSFAAGFDWHLTKPIDQASLIDLFRLRNGISQATDRT